MAERRNRIRGEEPEKKPRRSKRSRSSNDGAGVLTRFRAFLADRRTHKVGGLLLVLSAAYLTVAFVSYLFTWKIDQDLVSRSWSAIFSPEVRVENWLGKVGALVAHRFMHTWFGLAAFAFPLWAFLAGVRVLLGTWLLPVRRTLGWTAMALFWLPTLLGFIF
ncbi:MAG: DNA translocase FtsK 4TM domain-containing protein, partial [Flavobacteriales bacterium]|nr:DNA translocase FtsK 4TM domain-containing protein [Flavobacteriales bacterium]